MRLDAFERDFYRRKAVEVVTHKGERVEAWAYLLDRRHRSLLLPRRWEAERFEQHLLRPYLQQLKRSPCA